MDAGGRRKNAPAFSTFTTSLWLGNAGRQTAPAFAAFSTSCTSAVAETRKPLKLHTVKIFRAS